MTKKNLTRQRIIENVIACKRANIYEEPQLTQVAAMTGISTRTLNRYFPNKEELFYYAALQFMDQKCQDYLADFESFDKNGFCGANRLLAFLGMLEHVFKKETTDSVMYIMANNRCIQFRAGQPDAFHPFTGEIFNRLVSLLEEGKHDGSVKKELDSKTTAALVSSNFNGMILRLLSVYRADCPEEIAKREFVLFREYLKMLDSYLKP